MINQVIEEIAEKLLIDSNNFKAPIRPKLIAKHLKISINEVDLEDNISGFLALNNGTPKLGFNINHSENRQRFTIAHEIGHFILHAKHEPLFIDKNDKNNLIFNRDENSSTGEKLKEREANNFAAALLMPKKLLAEKIDSSKRKNDLNKLVIELSGIFKVSTHAMGIRLSQLGYIDYNSIRD